MVQKQNDSQLCEESTLPKRRWQRRSSSIGSSRSPRMYCCNCITPDEFRLRKTSRDDGSANNCSRKVSSSTPPSNVSGGSERATGSAVAGRTQQVINEEDPTTHTTISLSLGRESPIGTHGTDDFSEDTLSNTSGDWIKDFKVRCEYRRNV
jgi:hypothetical protein